MDVFELKGLPADWNREDIGDFGVISVLGDVVEDETDFFLLHYEI